MFLSCSCFQQAFHLSWGEFGGLERKEGRRKEEGGGRGGKKGEWVGGKKEERVKERKEGTKGGKWAGGEKRNLTCLFGLIEHSQYARY